LLKSSGTMAHRKVVVAATQMSCSDNLESNTAKAEALVREAAAKGANIILLQELFETLYFCQEQSPQNFLLAHTSTDDSFFQRFANLARELNVVLPISFFERANNAFYNSILIIDADGTKLGIYRKSHIPDGPGYQEKYYFTPGDTGFRVWDTKFGRIGVAICWDQWFPESARAMALQGAEIIFYPTAIGSEPPAPGYNSFPHWQRAMQGHSATNMVPVVASNRIGTENFPNSFITFYGHSFITDNTGKILQELDNSSEGVITAEFDLDELAFNRFGWGLFRDRRTDIYNVLLTKDGKQQYN